MAIATGSFTFSIREYAERMRSVDYDKCWPFPEERAGRPLPPMPVRRFRWWVDELRASRSDGRRTGNLVDPVDNAAGVDVVAGARAEHLPQSVHVVTAGDGAASSEEKQVIKTPYRAKQRTPKKKSILELFAVAPRIHCGGKERGEEPAVAKSSLRVANGGDSVELMIRKTRGKEGGKMVMDKIGAKKKLKVGRKMMRKKNNLKVEICAAKKEKTILFKRSSLDGFSKILKTEVYELFRKMHKKFVHNRLKAATIRTIVQRHAFKLVRTSNMEFKTLEEENLQPLHAKLKERNVVSSRKKKKEEEHLRGDELVDLVCEPSKYVISSEMDGTVLHDRTCLPLSLPHLQNLCKLVSDVLVESDSADSNEHPSMSKGAKLSLNAKKAKLSINDNGFDTSNSITGKTDSEKQLSDSCGHITATKASTWAEFDLNHPVQEHIDLNNSILDELTMPPSPSCLDGQKVPSPRNNVESDCDQRINQEQIFSFRSDHVNSSCISTGVSVSASSATSALIFTRNQDKQHWMYCADQRGMDLSERQTHFVDPMKDVSNGIVGLYGTPKQLVTSTCSSFQSKAIVESSPKTELMLGDICTVKDFVGLPLNSQGEFIQLHPGNRYDFHEADKMSNTELNSLQYLSSCSRIQPQFSHLSSCWTKGKFPFASFCHEDDQCCFLNHYHPASKVKISDLDSAVFQGQEKLKFQPHNSKAQVNISDDRQRGFFCCGCKDYIATECFNKMTSHSERDLEVGIRSETQPTMRLMGTNVTIGRYSKEHKGYNGEKIWTDEETTMSCHPTRVFNRAISNRWQDEECILKRDSGDSREIPSEFSSCFCTSADKLKSNHAHLGLGSNWMLEDWNSPSKPHGYNIDHSQSPVPCQSFLKKASYSLVHCTPETQSEEIGQRKASYPQNFCQHTLRSAHYRHHQSVSYSIGSACHPYYTNQVAVQTSRGLSLQEIPHWQPNTTSQDSPFLSCHPILEYQFCTVPQDIGFPYASPYRNSVISYPSGSSSISQTYGSYAPALYSSSTAALRKDNFSLLSSTYGYNIKARDGTGINHAYDENQHYSKRCRKRPASENIKIMETVKRPNIKLSVEREQFHEKQEDNMRESEINSYASKKDIRLPVVDLDKDTVVVSGGRLPLKSSHVRSGLIKLSAGAKHILRPNKSLDQENSSQVYVSVPFTQETSTGKGLVTLKEVAEATKV